MNVSTGVEVDPVPFDVNRLSSLTGEFWGAGFRREALEEVPLDVVFDREDEVEGLVFEEAGTFGSVGL